MNHRLELLREEKNLLKKDVAKQLGVVESVYSEWENNKLTIPTRRIVELADFYQVNIDYMLGLSDNREKISISTDINITDVSLHLKEVRKTLKYSMRKLAAKLNTSSSAISNYENGKFLILSPFLVVLAKESNYSIDWIMGRSNKKMRPKLEE